MAKVRIGFSTAFELENELVGIGTDNPTNTLQALGNIHSSNAVDSSIEYVTINSAGNAVDFGDVSVAKYLSAGCSDSHGGLGGF